MSGADGERCDSELLAAIGGGDRSALAELYRRHAAYLMGLAMRFLGDQREAEDLLHDVLLEAWQRVAQFDPERGTARAWLATRVRGRALDRLRVRKRRSFEPPPERVAPEDPGLDADRRRAHTAVARLSDVQRETIELAYFEGLSCSETAGRLGVPVGTVKSRLAAALSTLRKELDGSDQ